MASRSIISTQLHIFKQIEIYIFLSIDKDLIKKKLKKLRNVIYWYLLWYSRSREQEESPPPSLSFQQQQFLSRPEMSGEGFTNKLSITDKVANGCYTV